MALELFGFEIGKKKKGPSPLQQDTSTQAVSFVPPDQDDGAVYIDGGGYYGSFIDFDTKAQTEIEFIGKYREMAGHPEVESAVEDIINESIVVEKDKKSIELALDRVNLSDPIKKKMHEEFDHIFRLLKFHQRGPEIFRKWYIDGRLYYHMIVDEKNPKKGLTEMRFVDPTKIKKVVEIQKDKNVDNVDLVKETDEYYIFREDPNQQIGLKISPDAINYSTSGLFDSSGSRVISYLHKAIKPLNQLRMIEDAVVIYRISRAPERRIFYIDVGNLPKTKAEQYVRSLMNRYRNKLVYDVQTGEVRDDKRHMSMLEDFWLPRREGGKGTEISTLDGGQNLGEMDDVVYFQRKLYQSLNVPSTRLDREINAGIGRATEIGRDEVKFMKFIDRLRSKFCDVFRTALKSQLILKGIMTVQEWNRISHDVEFEFGRDNHFAELKDYEIISERMSILRDVNEYVGKFFSLDYIKRNVLRMTAKEIADMDEQIALEREQGLITDDSGGF